jgi:hypothetical protein
MHASVRAFSMAVFGSSYHNRIALQNVKIIFLQKKKPFLHLENKIKTD